MHLYQVKPNYVKAQYMNEEFIVVWTDKIGEGIETKIKGLFLDYSSLKNISVRCRNIRNPQGQKESVKHTNEVFCWLHFNYNQSFFTFHPGYYLNWKYIIQGEKCRIWHILTLVAALIKKKKKWGQDWKIRFHNLNFSIILLRNPALRVTSEYLD